MKRQTASTTGSPLQVDRRIREILDQLTDTRTKNTKIRTIFFSRYAHEYFTRVQSAYLAKSIGVRDELGIRWKDIKPSSKAQRFPPRRKKKDYTGQCPDGPIVNLRSTRPRGLLTPTMDKKWRAVFRSIYCKLIAEGKDQKAAAGTAARAAWTYIKQIGGKTKLAEFGNRKVPVLIDKGRLLKSVSPGKLYRYRYRRASQDQIFEINGSTMRIGSKVPYAKRQNKTRIFWPNPTRAKPWHRSAVSSGSEAVMDEIARRLAT